MSVARASHWPLLQLGLQVLLALQVALIAARVLSGGADALPLLAAAVVSALALALIEARSAWRRDFERGRR